MSAFSRHFWERVNMRGPTMPHMATNCHIWTGATFKLRGGYGAVGRDSKVEKAHRVAFELVNGRKPGPVLRHRCDNPPCVRVDHLIEGTHADNVLDKTTRDRVPHGERHHAARLTEEKVLEMRARRTAGALLSELCVDYGISMAAASTICRGKAWRRVAHGQMKNTVSGIAAGGSR